ncbi:latent-transforming growth factor beta-binding protein 1 isoform X3 [Scleropages formosus]|uniref:latent-transforming growth factor beta-binding protein 1 isoform X3 n=1 Tax=Scleropages formosus TaxID=113540 RepID=UPI0010FA86F7|nr:latent-transforming growth factor beta-binding protein 1 isoform X3 [Scleropages formosus]
MDMAWLRWNIFLSIGLFVSPAFASTELSGFRTLYVLQPGASAGDALRMSAISSRAGSREKPRAITAELGDAGGQVRTRRMGSHPNPSAPLRHESTSTHQQQQQVRRAGHTSSSGAHHSQMTISGINVCGGQCCQGWSRAPGSQRCTKPNCQPQCQNGGMCLRPQLCICKPGSKGKACEQKTLPPSNPPTAGHTPGRTPSHTNGHTTGHTNGHTNGAIPGQGVVPQRPIPQQASPLIHTQGHVSGPHTSMAQMTLTVKQSPQLLRPQSATQLVQPPLSRTFHQTQHFVIKPKYYHPPVQSGDRAIPLTGGHSNVNGGNHTGRIRVVFTPSICKMTCSGGKCQNSCEMGNTTTIISENGHATDTLTASNFRVVVCHLPCMNGGRCSNRDRCQCPPNFTGKFCQVPVQGSAQQQLSISHSQGTQVHSTHTLPLTFGGGQNQVKFSPNIVNIHVKHPPEATVQVHQVSQLDGGDQQVKGSQSGHYSYHQRETSQKSQQSQHTYSNQRTIIHHYPVTSNSMLGRCFQETTGMQCGKALPGLSKQEDCCNSVGTSWGFHKCQKCPKKTSIPLTDLRHAMDCPQGYKRINNSYCQDVNECLLQGVCPNGHCLNTPGSYMCMCKPGYFLDPTRTTCIPDTPAVLEEKGACFRFVGSGKQCLHPVSVQLSRQLCCCSVGKAWGPHCDKCPSPGTAAFKDICPGGMGYTVSGTYRPKPINRNQPEEIHRPKVVHQEPQLPPVPLPTVQRPIEALSVTERQIPAVPEVVEKTSPPAPVAILPSSASQGIAPTQLAEVNECHVSPDICGPGICYNTAEGYTCICHSGYQLDEERITCRDVNECQDPDVCGQDGVCINTAGSFTCRHCQSGYRMSETGNCEDINECLDPGACPAGLCTNTWGSYVCDPCPEGFEVHNGKCFDVDECQDSSICANGDCSNLEGNFLCTCHDGYQLSPDGRMCTDIDECQDERVCASGHCQNTDGSFVCNCEAGFKLSSARDQCDDVDECKETPEVCGSGGVCINILGSYRCVCSPGFHTGNNSHCEDVDECLEDPELCGPHGICQNTQGSFSCVCAQGFIAHEDYHTCEDVDECSEGNRCRSGSCINTDGSFHCRCDRGYRLQADNETCLDVDECEMFGQSICGAWRCENTIGSYRCIVECPPGHILGPDGICVDVNECALNETVCGPHGFCENTVGSFRCLCHQGFQETPDGQGCVDVNECALNETVCGPHGFCENTVGSFRCLCDRGFQETPDGQGCVDVNECELLSGVCGEALCDNVEGSFLCLCPEKNQEFNHMTAKCSPAPTASSVERKECYYNLNDENLCDNVLTSSVTIEECCCTLGAGWGDNCEVHPCPVEGTDQFHQMCPAGKGSIPNGDSVFEVASANGYKDADECVLFGDEICKDGFCLNTPMSYECYCKQGLYYDDIKLQCLDIDECMDKTTCLGGQCINTLGSYMCFCSPPMVLDPSGMHCVTQPPLAEQDGFYQDICWQTVTDTMTCAHPLADRKTTYMECCCTYGEAWGMNCALCPWKDREDFIAMCNVPEWGRRPYGRDALTAPGVHYHEADPEIQQSSFKPPVLPLYKEEENPYDAFEGLRAEECGVLNGCENGRCVRVQEGYTCDCFDGYTLDMSRMACIDVNECSELNNRMVLCKNGKCINTQGSYKCVCLPGFVRSERPNYCVPGRKEAGASDTE